MRAIQTGGGRLSVAMRRLLCLTVLLSALLGCSEEETISFGAVLPLSGEHEIYGQPILKGIEVALEELQGQSDFPYAVEVDVMDSEGDPEKGAQLLEELYNGGAFAAVGGVTTAEALAMVTVADREDRVLVSPSASSPELTGISKNFYRVFPSDSREGTTMGNFASRKLQIENAVIITKEDPFARGIQEVFKTEFERNQGQVVDVIEYPEGAADFTGIIERVMTVRPQAVYVAAYADDTGKIIAALRNKGFEGSILTTAAFAVPEVIERVGAAAEGIFLTRAVFELDSEEQGIQDFVERFREKYGLSPDLYAAHGYDALMVLAASLVESGPFAGDFWKGIRALRDYPGVTGTIQFDEKGDAQKFPRVYVIENGNLVDYEKEVERRRRELLERLRQLEEQQRERGTN
ncbi:MAG: ABC transporter substrate-binding protein [Thermoanaerobaculia bacterium]|nr:ABC transporter substrate-binding protein [Thermoanaerobaculia bacterium]